MGYNSVGIHHTITSQKRRDSAQSFGRKLNLIWLICIYWNKKTTGEQDIDFLYSTYLKTSTKRDSFVVKLYWWKINDRFYPGKFSADLWPRFCFRIPLVQSDSHFKEKITLVLIEKKLKWLVIDFHADESYWNAGTER